MEAVGAWLLPESIHGLASSAHRAFYEKVTGRRAPGAAVEAPAGAEDLPMLQDLADAFEGGPSGSASYG
eukprot:6902981-Pyramimonas_sp.AAC.1